ncbi:TetR/AcrR family transcriptional regulator [Actinomadura hibisca]|uniref:TetR/AcrR family transcriptional regulator n=1 Tax=Actinomadura hibisca TaxID=68565 RepID=UPI000833CD35|nr:TetR/AcrR family transcriptional regulator [Actinomadura hibisca]
MQPSSSAVPTRDRILDVAMELFSTRGFRGTSITQIEKAAGLTPGAGGIYHHFRTKEDLLKAGIARQLARLDAVRTIKDALGPLGDIRAELTVFARYTLAELDRERELIQIMAAESRNHPGLLGEACNAIFGTALQQFADLLRRAGLPEERAPLIASIGFGALTSRKTLHIAFGPEAVSPFPEIDDDSYIDAWIDMMETLLATP